MACLFKGCGTALVTPFKPSGEVDYEAYESLVRRQVKEGVDFLVALATTGETPALSTEEKLRLLELTKANCGGRPVMVGCGSNSVPGTLENMRLLGKYAPDAWLVVVPFYNKPTQEGMFRYFEAIAGSTDIPVFIYNVPGRTGANMAAETALRIAREVPGVVGTKEASGKSDQIVAIIKGRPAGFVVLSGDDDMTLGLMKEGADGVISVASNAAPKMVSDMTRAAASGDWKTAGRLDSILHPLFVNCFVESNPIPVKAGLEHLGLCSSTMRLPLTGATAGTRRLMAETLDALPCK